MRSKFHFLLKNGDTATLDAATNQLSISPQGGETNSVTLAYAESRLLQLLLLEPGEIKSRTEIMEFAWDNRVVAAGSLNQAIFTLRNLINDGRDHDLLQTVPRRGYRFNASYVVDEVGAVATEQIDQAASEEVIPSNETPLEPVEAAVVQRAGTKFEWGRLLVPAYVLMSALLVAVFSYRAGLFDGVGSELVMDHVAKGPLTYHFIGVSEAETARLMAEFKPVLEARKALPAGEVWVNKANRLYDLSCVRADGRTGNLMFSEDNKREDLMLAMVGKCLGDSQ
ncbi:DNA-binding transcriptional activator CadC [compost metagenome]